MVNRCLLQYLSISSLLSICALYRPASAQFGPPCTPGTPPPPELKPLDSDANLLPGCLLSSDDQVQKSAISEITAQQLALCNSFCMDRVFSGTFTLNDTQKQIFPGYPVWFLATLSYLLSDDGASGTDCVVGENINGCDRICPPSACRNIKSTSVGAQSLNVQWEKPEITGRDDYYYMLQYTDGESVGSNQVINQSQVVSQQITGLKPITEYTITVTVVNGVSDQDKKNELKRICQLIVTTTERVPSSPVDVQSYGDVVVWNEPLSPNGQVTEYEIQFLVPDTQLRINRSRNSRGTFYAVQDEDKLGGIENTYFRVRARTLAGAGQWSTEIPLRSGMDVTPTPPTTCPTCSCPICTCPVCPTTAPPCTCGTETPTSLPLLQGVHFVLRGRLLPNNSIIALADVGELDGALLCQTNLTSCCGTVPNRFGQFYYPSGVAVPINRRQQGFYRNRGDQEIRLHRRSGVNSPTGKFRCEIPDSNMIVQNLFIELI